MRGVSPSAASRHARGSPPVAFQEEYGGREGIRKRKIGMGGEEGQGKEGAKSGLTSWIES